MRLTSREAHLVQVGLFKEALRIIQTKREGYASKDDPFRNFRQSESWGTEPWKGAGVRLQDKLTRMQRLAEVGGMDAVVDDPLLDTVRDSLNYVVITFSLILESLPDHAARRILEELIEASRQPWRSDDSE